MERFAIACYPRTGSSHLVGLLCSHPQVICLGEIFNPTTAPGLHEVTDPAAYAELLWGEKAQQKRKATHSGYKIFAQHALNHPLSEIWKYMQDKQFKIILLTRKNLLNRYLSHELVEAHAIPGMRSYAWSSVEFRKPVVLDPESCVKDFEKYRKLEKRLEKTFANNPVFRLNYEELCDRDTYYPKILEFLGLPYSKPISHSTKQRTQSQQMMIKNYWELKSSLKDTEYIEFFDEEEKTPLL